jgi:hypothetical protein
MTDKQMEDKQRAEFEAFVKENFGCSEHSFNREAYNRYYNAVSSNTFGGREPVQYAAMSMLWKTWQAARRSQGREVPDILFDGYAAYRQLDDKASVLDALVKAIRAAAPDAHEGREE